MCLRGAGEAVCRRHCGSPVPRGTLPACRRAPRATLVDGRHPLRPRACGREGSPRSPPLSGVPEQGPVLQTPQGSPRQAARTGQQRAGRYPPWTPGVLTYRAYSDWDAAINRRLRWSPPKHTLAQRSGQAIRPSSVPSGAKTTTPSNSAVPMPQPHQRLPSMSHRIPSGVPPGPASISTCVFRSSRPLPVTS